MNRDDLRVDSANKIDALRRHPERCLYCAEPALSKEHSLPHGVGGRLWAANLCSRHNGIVNTGADEHFNETFAPYMTMLQVAKQDRTVGATVNAKDADGACITILPSGLVKQRAFEALAHHYETRKIVRARGDLEKLDAIPKTAFSKDVQNHVIAVITNPEVNVSVDSSDGLSGALLKIALHFYHGFVGDVDQKIALELLDLILAGNACASTHVRTPLFEVDVFPDMETPRHEVTCYPHDADSCLVTILLFGAYAYTIRLPFPMQGAVGIRYRQMLDQRYPELYDNVMIPENLKWESRPESAEQHEEFVMEARKRVSRLHERGAHTAVHVMCRRAYELAVGESANLGNLWERYRAALQLEALTAEQIDAIVYIGWRRQKDGLLVWEVPIKNIGDHDEDIAEPLPEVHGDTRGIRTKS